MLLMSAVQNRVGWRLFGFTVFVKDNERSPNYSRAPKYRIAFLKSPPNTPLASEAQGDLL